MISLLQSFLILQWDRVKLYRQLDDIFEDYLAESVADNVSTFKLQNAVQEYQRGCQDILAEFQKINAAVKDVEEKLLANNNSSEKDLLRSIQLLERDNFETTMQQQRCKQQLELEKRKERKLREEEEHVHDDTCMHKHESNTEEDITLYGEKVSVFEKEYESLQHKKRGIVQQINELIEEIQMTISERDE